MKLMLPFGISRRALLSTLAALAALPSPLLFTAVQAQTGPVPSWTDGPASGGWGRTGTGCGSESAVIVKSTAGRMTVQDGELCFLVGHLQWRAVSNFNIPAHLSGFGSQCPDTLWGWLVGAFLAYTGAVLILSSQDLRRRASIVYWESILRYIAALLVILAGLFGDLGMIAVPLGLGDLAIGLVYMFSLPKEFRVSHHSLFCDRLN